MADMETVVEDDEFNDSVYAPANEYCGSCRHWIYLGLDVDDPNEPSECRRYPPVPIASDESVWPILSPAAFCGEHDPSPNLDMLRNRFRIAKEKRGEDG